MLLGVDVGGTFTDAALLDGDRLVTAKAPTTPADQSRGVADAVRAALAEAGADAASVTRFVHGMTVATNALLEGRTARTVLFATEGFTDLEELRRQNRADLYRLCAGHAEPIARLRVPVPERTGPDGVVLELDEEALRARIAELPDDCESAAVCRRGGSFTKSTSAGLPSCSQNCGRTCTFRPRTGLRPCSASTSAAQRRWST